MATILGFEAFIVTYNLGFSRLGLTGSNSGLAAVSGVIIIVLVTVISYDKHNVWSNN